MSLNIDLVHFLVVIVFSFLIGLEVKSYRREFSKVDSSNYFFGDVRTYTFIGILGFVLFKINPTLYYSNPWTENIYDASVYIITTCGALMLSSSISVQLFGFLNFIGLIVIFLLKPYGFTSLWCLYAAGISGLLYFYFVERRIKFLQDIKEKKDEFGTQFEKELNSLNKRRISFVKEVKNYE